MAIIYNGVQVAGDGGLPSNSQTFTSSGTFTVPTGVTKVLVWACGGGGGGAGGYYTTTINGTAGGSTYFGSINFFGSYVSVANGSINGAGGRAGAGSGSKSGTANNDGADGTYGGGGITSPYNVGTAGGNATNIGAGGGGVEGRIGGGSSRMDFELVSVTPGQVITVTIGAGGAAVVYASPYRISGAGYRGEVRVYW